jgi:hypothetical protein
MILLDNTIISEDILEKNFICNLSVCKGACCIEGDFGAPITEEEIETIGAELSNILPFLNSESVNEINKKGIWEKDIDGDLVTTCLPSGECNFSIKESDGTLKCGIEQANKAGKSSIQKPLSCHLYPIRISKVGNYDAVNYHKWDICKPACKLGDEHKLPVFQFLKIPLIRKFGTEWFNDLSFVAAQWESDKIK